MPLPEYVTYSIQGVNQYGQVQTDVNKEALYIHCSEELKEEKLGALDALLDSMSVSASPMEGLSNGDVITFHVSYDEELLKEAHVKFQKNDFTVTVEGLSEGDLVDLFQDITIEVTGIAPYATASIVNQSSDTFFQQLPYELDVTTGFWPGDVLHVTCPVTDETLRSQYYVTLSKEKEYLVNHQDAYARSAEDVSQEFLTNIVQSSVDTLQGLAQGTQVRLMYRLTKKSNYLFQYNVEKIQNTSVASLELLTVSDENVVREDPSIPYNMLILVLSTNVANADYDADGYFIFRYDNVVLTADGTCVVDQSHPELRFICGENLEELTASLQSTYMTTYQSISLDSSSIVITQ
ncbi:MAG: hypothetical protein K6C69_01255 [Lachnospiraceae bacterium]|nr:hypothetical protein [Lachnospiraceae bacterium]